MTPADLLLRLRLPVVAAPMFLVSGPDLVIAASRAGILGSFPTPNCRTAAELDDWMTRIQDGLGRGPDAGLQIKYACAHCHQPCTASDNI